MIVILAEKLIRWDGFTEGFLIVAAVMFFIICFLYRMK